jgi:hypothetical protein
MLRPAALVALIALGAGTADAQQSTIPFGNPLSGSGAGVSVGQNWGPATPNITGPLAGEPLTWTAPGKPKHVQIQSNGKITSEDQASNAIRIEAATKLTEQYRANAIVAHATYGGGPIIITGDIDKKINSGIATTMLLKGDKPNETLTVYFDSKSFAAAAAHSADKPVLLRCAKVQYAGFTVVATNCVI